MEKDNLDMEQLSALAEFMMNELSRSEEGRKIIRRCFSGSLNDIVSNIEQLPKELSDEVVKTLPDAYEKLIGVNNKERNSS